MGTVSLEFAHLSRRLKDLTGFDLHQYKPDQMERRTRQWMARRGVSSMAALVRLLDQDPRARTDLINHLTISTSQFFRDPSVFAALRDRVLPELLALGQTLEIWSAGCSIGAEPYSLAILLDRAGQSGRHHILATDIDDDALEQARAGRYHDLHLTNLPEELRRRYFTPVGPGAWELAPSIRQAVNFRRHDLLKDPCRSGFHLILFRYVLIYLTPEAQQAVLMRLSQALASGGYLVVGGPEHIPRPDALGLERKEHCIYRRVR